MIKKLEAMGHRIGESLVERVSRDTPRFKSELDAVIFICKSLWVHAFAKQIDNLKTNHQVCKHCSSALVCTLLFSIDMSLDLKW